VSTGVDFAFDTTGSPVVLRQAVQSLDSLGACGFVAPAGTLELPVVALFEGRTLRGIEQGDSLPQVFIPQLIDLWRTGRFPFDRLISFFSFEQIDEAGRASRRGDVVKPVLRFG
jgi:aryl-alcohol dehydrogenase